MVFSPLGSRQNSCLRNLGSISLARLANLELPIIVLFAELAIRSSKTYCSEVLNKSAMHRDQHRPLQFLWQAAASIVKRSAMMNIEMEASQSMLTSTGPSSRLIAKAEDLDNSLRLRNTSL